VTNRDLAVFVRAAVALEPYLDSLVVIGGWAHRLHREHPRALAPGFEPVFTEDADLALPPDLKPIGDSMSQRLRLAGFRERFLGDEMPPIMRFYLGEEHSGFYLEFLTWRQGSGRKRDGSPDDRMPIAGVTAQKLKHLDLLMLEPWSVRLAADSEDAPPRELSVQVANPVAFILQKLLILEKRTSPDKDVLYVFDTLELFGAETQALAATFEAIRARVDSRLLGAFHERRQRVFGSITDPVVGAARIASSTGRPSPPSPQRIIEVCSFGLDAVFGSVRR